MELQRIAAARSAVIPGVTIMPSEPAEKENASSRISVIQSRFGAVAVNLDQAIDFPQGLLGLPDKLRFCLTDMPGGKSQRFKLLQSLSDEALSFVVLPLGLDNPYIARADLEECCKVARIKPENLLVLILLSVQRSPDSVKVTGNVRAPVIVDVRDRAAMQYVFPHGKYEICHPLLEK